MKLHRHESPLSRQMILVVTIFTLGVNATPSRGQSATVHPGRPSAMQYGKGPGPIKNGKPVKHVPGKPYVGQLTKPLEQYNGSDLYNLKNSVSSFGWERERVCSKKHAECMNGTPAARVQIEALGDANSIAVTGDSSATPFGVVIGIMRNVGLFRDSITHVAGDESPPSDLFFVVQPRKSGTAGLKIATVTYKQGVTPVIPDVFVRIDTTASGLTPCPPTTHGGDTTHRKRDYPQADFATCNMPARQDSIPDKLLGRRGSGSHKTKSLHHGPPPPTEINATPWFSCNEGCCTTTWPPEE